MKSIVPQIKQAKIALEVLAELINKSPADVNTAMNSVEHILSEYTHDRKMESIGGWDRC